MQTFKSITLAQQLLLPKVCSARCIIDATAGNGKDTLFLASNSPNETVIYAFDIQQEAIVKSKKRLTEHQLDSKVRLILDNHANIETYVSDPIDVVMFNLGYLPGKSHDTFTLPETTIVALAYTVRKLIVGGIISIITYPGFKQGQHEHEVVHNYVSALPPSQFTVICIDFINHTENPPVLYLIEKVRGEANESSPPHEN